LRLGGGVTASQLNGIGNVTGGITTLLGDQTTDAAGTPTVPKAYINYIFFDEQFKVAQSGFSRAGSNSVVKTHTDLTNKTAPKNGYVYIYVSNESPVDVFFDNLQVIHTRGAILEETHYYPFGLTMAGISSKALAFGNPENKKGYNGNEMQNREFSDGSGLEFYDFNARMYDQQIGRFLQIDPDIEKGEQETQSPYHFAKNNPVRYNDPDGKCPTCPPSDWEMRATENGKLGQGLVQSAKETVTGLANAVAHPINTLKGIGNAILHPIETVQNVIEGVKNDFKADPTIASGKILGDVLQVAIGGEIVKGVSKSSTVSGLGDLTKAEIKTIQNVVNEAERPIEVVGSAANGARRGVGSDLPIGKGAGTKSDIDYIAPPSSIPNFNQSKLPSIDPKTGIVPGYGNPFQGPVIRFEPGTKPIFIPKTN